MTNKRLEELEDTTKGKKTKITYIIKKLKLFRTPTITIGNSTNTPRSPTIFTKKPFQDVFCVAAVATGLAYYDCIIKSICQISISYQIQKIQKNEEC